MSYRERKGLLLIADISSYTEYLEHAELAHAEEIISQLLEATIDAAPTGFELAKLEGDAGFFVLDEERLTGQIVTDAIRSMFVAFHDRLSRAVAETSCRCRGCICACKLALKFVAHHGAFGEHFVHGLRELIGADVILVHRLLKNTVQHREYALLTDSLVRRCGAEVPPLDRHTDRYEHIGEVEGGVWDLAPLCAGFHG
jgi:hypothetical protein